ncbi:hypothetical protein BH10BAC2_BH10BAC2_25180 [soil metagenome]
MVTPGRSYSSGTLYRYGFNGKENDNEVKGTGNQQDYGMRIYDPRLGRFLSVDPIAKDYPSLTPYQFASNQPIESIDKDGMERMDYRLTLSDGKAQMQLLSTGPSKEIIPGVFGTDLLKATIDIPKHYRVEYNGQHYIFASGGQESDYVKKMPPAASSFGTAVQVYTVAELWAFQKNPDAFLKTLTSEEEFDHELAFLELGEELGRELNSGLNWGGTKNKSGKAPAEPYNRQKHYGKTPTAADRKALGASSTDDIDHQVSLVKHYYEGDGKGGEPGYSMTSTERKTFAKDRSNMAVVQASTNRSDGGKLSQYSKEMKEKYFKFTPKPRPKR